MQKTTWQGLDTAERTELEATLRAPDKFLSDEDEAAGFWLLLGLASVGGIIAFLYDRATDSYGPGLRGVIPFVGGVPNPLIFITQPQLLGFYVAIGVAVWVTYSFVTSHGRRGVAMTSYGLARVRGRKVQLFRYRDIASVSQRSLGRRGNRFTVLTLVERDGKSYELYCYAGWAEAAQAKIAAATPRP